MRWLRAALRFIPNLIAAITQEGRDRESHRALYQALTQQPRASMARPAPAQTGNTELDPVTGREIPKQSEL